MRSFVKIVLISFFLINFTIGTGVFNIIRPAGAQYFDEVKKFPADPALYIELLGILEKTFTNSVISGKTKIKFNGAETSSKFIIYCSNLETRRIDIESYEFPMTILQFPNQIVQYLQKTKVAVVYKNLNPLTYNMKKLFEDIRIDGKISKKIDGNKILYQVLSYTSGLKILYVVDASTGYVKQVKTDDSDAQKASEYIFDAMQFKKIGKDVFEVPRQATLKEEFNKLLGERTEQRLIF